MLTRFGLMFVIDVMMCVFITFAMDKDKSDENHSVNLSICYTLVGLLSFLVLFEVVHGVWRYWKARRALEWSDYEVSGYISTLYEGGNL
jgi:FlaA1/EpsC-like NDP-sugar epimerase